MHARKLGLASLALAVSTAVNAAGNSPSQNFDLRSRTPVADYYAYAGAEWLGGNDLDDDVFAVPLETRVYLKHDVEIALDSSVTDLSGDGRAADMGDTYVRLAKWLPPMGFLDYLAVEYTETLASGSTVTNGIERTFGLRTQGGATRLGVYGAVEYQDLDERSLQGSTAFSYTAGYRGQFGRSHWGFDFNHRSFNEDDVDDEDSLAVILMRSFSRGDGSFYATVQKGISSGFDVVYVSAGLEYRFGR